MSVSLTKVVTDLKLILFNILYVKIFLRIKKKNSKNQCALKRYRGQIHVTSFQVLTFISLERTALSKEFIEYTIDFINYRLGEIRFICYFSLLIFSPLNCIQQITEILDRVKNFIGISPLSHI